MTEIEIKPKRFAQIAAYREAIDTVLAHGYSMPQIFAMSGNDLGVPSVKSLRDAYKRACRALDDGRLRIEQLPLPGFEALTQGQASPAGQSKQARPAGQSAAKPAQRKTSSGVVIPPPPGQKRNQEKYAHLDFEVLDPTK